MTKKSKLLSALLPVLFILNCSCTVSADTYSFSPALEILACNTGLVKSTVMTKELKFTRDDFEKAVGAPVEYITVESIPDSSVGVLKYAGSDVRAGRTIPAENLKLLKFTPARTTGSTSFSFSYDSSGNALRSCTVNVLAKQNNVPLSENMNIEALSGIGFVKCLDIYDPDGDSVSTEIISFPENGVVKLCGDSFVYTSVPGFSGKDSFVYSVTDSFGNTSDAATVSVNVRKADTDVSYSDMTGHWGYTSALRMTELGLMKGEREKGMLYFRPEEPVSRGDFLAMAMICAGMEDKIKPGAETTFADNREIPLNIRCYAAYAQAGGIIDASTENNKRLFESSKAVTRAQAAKIVSGILKGAKSAGRFDFVDAASIPDWARDSFASVVSLGIINGNPEGTLRPQETVTRAQAAQILCNMIDYLEEKNKKQ